MKNLGTPTTLGEFRKLTEQYSNETLLQFRNEPVHDLIDIDGELCFNETNRWDNIRIIGHGFKGAICGINEAKTIFIAHEDIIKYPLLKSTINECLSVEQMSIDQFVHKVEFALAISPEVIENFKNKTESLKMVAKEAALASERIGVAMDNPSFNENKKRKGHERPYKYHR